MSTIEETFVDVTPYSAGVVERFKKITKNLLSFSDANFEQFRNIIKASNAIVSGSSVLNSLFSNENGSSDPKFPADAWAPGDLDIYVQAKDFIPLRDFLISKCKKFLCPKKNATTGTYGVSFFKMNQIVKMYKFSFGEEYNYCVDLMMVQNNRNLEDMIRNYDLSCCKNIYDGEIIKGITPEETIKGNVKSNPSFFKLYIEKNHRVIKRAKKYEKRGFKITITGSFVIGGPSSPKSETQPYNAEEAKNYILDLIFMMITKVAKPAEIGHDIHGSIFAIYYGSNSVLNLKDLYDAVPNNFPAKNMDKSKFKYGNNNDDGLDPSEFDSREKYAVFGPDYPGIFDMLVEGILDKYEAFNPTSQKEISRKKLRIDPCIEFLKELNEKSASAVSEVYPELKNLICFDDSDLGEYSISKYMVKSRNVIVKINDDYKGYTRGKLINEILKSDKFLANQKISSEGIDRFRDTQTRFFELIDTGLGNSVVIPYTVQAFIKKFKSS